MAYEYESKETRVLKTIDSKRYPDTNKDFEKNIRRLNSSVDYISSYMRVMQKGIDDANKNFIEQIQSFINDLIVLFAGGEPTGIEIGDLKYIIQAIGALFGFGSSPFPINLLDAAAHFFQGFLAPLVQLTDLIFDAINAWMQDFADKLDGVPIIGGLADNLAHFFNNMTDDITGAIEGAADAFAHAQDIIDTFISSLGLPSWSDVQTAIGNFFGGIFNGIDFLIFNPIDAAVQFISNFLNPAGLLASWGELFGNLTGGLVGGLEDLGRMIRDGIFGLIHPGRLPLVGTGQIGDTSPNLLTNGGFDGAVSISGTDFVHDATDGHTTNGCAKTTATGATKSLVANNIAVTENQSLNIGVWVKYTGVTATASSNAIRVNIIAYDSAGGLVSNSMVAAIASPSGNSSGPWIQLTGSYTVPAGVASVVMQLQVTSAASAGTIKFDDATAKKTGLVPQTLVSGLQSALSSLSTDISNVVGDLATLANKLLTNAGTAIGNIASVVVDAVGSTLQNAWDWLTHLFGGGKRNSASATDPPISSSTLSNVIDAAENVSTATYNTQFATEAQVAFFNEPRILPAWLASLPDDVAFPLTSISGSSAATLGRLQLIPVRISQDRIIDAIKFGCTATTMTSIYVGLYDVDETTGDCTKVIDLGNVKASLDIGYNMQTIKFSDYGQAPVSVQRNELYYIGVLQVGGTQAPMHGRGSGFDFTTGQFPRYLGMHHTTSGLGALPSTFAQSNLATSTQFWGALGTAAPPVTPAQKFYSDSFNRANASTLGSSWTLRAGGNPEIYSNTASRASGGSYGVSSFVNRLVGADVRVSAKLVSGPGAGIWLRGNGSGPMVYAKFGQSGTPNHFGEIYTASSYSGPGSGLTGGTLRNSFSVNTAGTNATYTLTASGSLYTLTCSAGGSCSWNDSGGAFSYNSSNNEVGVMFSNLNSYLDDFTARDL